MAVTVTGVTPTPEEVRRQRIIEAMIGGESNARKKAQRQQRQRQQQQKQKPRRRPLDTI